MKSIAEISFIWSTLGKYKKSSVFLLLIILATALSETLGLGMILPLLDIIVNPDTSANKSIFLMKFLDFLPQDQHLLFVCVIFLLLTIIKRAFFLYQTYYANKFIMDLRRYWSGKIMNNYMHSKFSYLVMQRQGVLLYNMVNEPSFASKALRDLTDFVAKMILSASIIILLLTVNWQITIILIFISVVIMLLIWRTTQKYSYAVGKKKIKLNQQISAVAAESISGVRQIKTFSMENAVIREFFNKLDLLFNVLLKFQVMSSLPRAFGEIIIIFGVVGILFYYKYAVSASLAAALPLLGFFLVSAQKLFENVSKLLSQRMGILSYLPSLKLVTGIVNDHSVLEKMDSNKQVEPLKNSVLFHNVTFNHKNGKSLFRDLDITIPKGSITAIGGPSGSGKSTICDLLIGFYKPVSGEILVDSVNLKEYNIQSWRNHIGYVSQDSYLFNLTVRENILIGKPDATESEIVTAAKQAGAGEFIENLPDKYNAVIGESGVNLSGGQRQRIAIARALIRNPDILIFDEATSSLDAETERGILDLLRGLRGMKTILVITHRLSSLEFTDNIYVLDKGSVVESGRYNELIKQKGLFWRLERLHREKPAELPETSQQAQLK